MRISTLEVQSYRSIEKMNVEGLGQFNVLIGQNSSGKSTVLAAIEAFFCSLRAGSVVSLEPMILRPIDFFDNDVARDLYIALTFQLSAAEREELVAKLKEEQPQVSRAAENLPPDCLLRVEVSYHLEPQSPFENGFPLLRRM